MALTQVEIAEYFAWKKIIVFESSENFYGLGIGLKMECYSDNYARISKKFPYPHYFLGL